MQLTRDKRQILEAAVRQHKSVIHDFKERIRDMMGNNGNVNEEEYDAQEQSFKAETSAKVECVFYLRALLYQMNLCKRSLSIVTAAYPNLKNGS